MNDQTCALVQLIRRDNCERAIYELWTTFSHRLQRRVRRLLAGVPKQLMDEEDIAICVFTAFCRALKDQRYTHIQCELDIWRLMAQMARRRVIDYHRYLSRERRSGGDTLTLSINVSDAPVYTGEAPDDAVGRNEQLEKTLNSIDDGRLRFVADAKIMGYTNLEIAQQEQCSLRTVERNIAKLKTHFIRHGHSVAR